MFEVTGESVLMLFEGHLTGEPTSTLLVVTQAALSETALDALRKSARSLEFGDAPLAVVTLASDEGTLGAEDLRTLVEGLDPVALVAANAAAAETLSAAYRTPLTPDAPNRLLGRTVVIFQNFEALMGTPDDKQKAWALLKKLR